jgi:hypothetical protein
MNGDRRGSKPPDTAVEAEDSVIKKPGTLVGAEINEEDGGQALGICPVANSPEVIRGADGGVKGYPGREA